MHESTFACPLALFSVLSNFSMLHFKLENASKKFYIEIKPFKPNLMEESLCEKVAFSKGVPVYLMPYVHQARE